jgi:hypothetical protein
MVQITQFQWRLKQLLSLQRYKRGKGGDGRGRGGEERRGKEEKRRAL